MQRSTFFEYRKHRYFKVAIALTAIALMAYAFDGNVAIGFGGTALGYSFGILATLIALVLLSYGIRKRLTWQFVERRKNMHPVPVEIERRVRKADWWRHKGATLQGWLSAHVHLGMAMVALATLHTGFQFGWNLHTVSYALMLVVIMSGFYGIYAYLYFPRLMTDNMEGDTFRTLRLKIEDLDKLAGVKSLQFSDEICAIVLRSRQETRIGGSFFQQLRGHQSDCPTASAVIKLKEFSKGMNDDEIKSFNDLYSIMVHKEDLVKRAWRDVKYRARVASWLYLHVPLSIAFLVALVAHIIAIFYYW